jgi:hypothetical protein
VSDVATRNDPVLNQNFVISLLDSTSVLSPSAPPVLTAILDGATAGFSECGGLELTMQAEEYREGGNNAALKRGISGNSDLWDWHFSFVEGRGKRRDGVIVLLDGSRQPRQAWYFRRGLPVKYSGPSLNAAQNSVAIEAIEIAHEGLQQIAAAGA